MVCSQRVAFCLKRGALGGALGERCQGSAEAFQPRLPASQWPAGPTFPTGLGGAPGPCEEVQPGAGATRQEPPVPTGLGGQSGPCEH